MATEDNDKKTCFVIGPIGKSGTDKRDRADTLLEYIIKPAVEPLGYEVIRADQVDDPGTITDRIVKDTLNSDLVIADLTDHSANAYYELGIRHNEGKPTVHMLIEGQEAPFDLSDQRHVKYKLDNPKDHLDAVNDLRAKVEATHAKGYQVQNPVTRARGHARLSASADSTEQLLATMLDSIRVLERDVRELKVTTPHDLPAWLQSKPSNTNSFCLKDLSADDERALKAVKEMVEMSVKRAEDRKQLVNAILKGKDLPDEE